MPAPLIIPLASVNAEAYTACHCAAGSVVPYGSLAWLRAVAPGLQVLVWPSAEGYEAVLPLPISKKWGVLPYVAMPPLTQRVGLYTHPQADRADKAGMARQAHTFLQKRFVRVHLSLDDYSTASALATMVQAQTNLVVDLSLSAEALEANLGKSIRQKLKIAKTEGLTLSSAPVTDLAGFISNLLSPRHRAWTPAHSAAAISLSQAGSSSFALHGQWAMHKGTPVAGAIWVVAAHRRIYLAGASTALGLQVGAMAALIWASMEQHAGTPGLLLDFEGGNNAGTGQFFRMFGAQEEPYWSVHLGL